MCIRDSLSCAGDNGVNVHPYRGYVFLTGQWIQLRDGAVKVCLLYTSDAADERSSVDLGGRRIIKKKKLIKRSRGS